MPHGKTVAEPAVGVYSCVFAAALWTTRYRRNTKLYSPPLLALFILYIVNVGLTGRARHCHIRVETIERLNDTPGPACYIAEAYFAFVQHPQGPADYFRIGADGRMANFIKCVCWQFTALWRCTNRGAASISSATIIITVGSNSCPKRGSF